MSSPNSLSSNCMFSSFICVFAKHDYEQNMTMNKLLFCTLGCSLGMTWSSCRAACKRGLAAGIDGVWALPPSWLAGGKTWCSQGKRRRIKPFCGSYVLHCYLCERQVHHYCTVYGRDRVIMGSSVLCRSHNNQSYVISRCGPLYVP